VRPVSEPAVETAGYGQTRRWRLAPLALLAAHNDDVLIMKSTTLSLTPTSRNPITSVAVK